MAILSDRDIKKRLNKDLEIEGVESYFEQIQPASVDLRLGNHFLIYIHSNECIDTKEKFEKDIYNMKKEFREKGESFTLYPHELVLCSTVEYIKLPSDLVGRLSTRSSLARYGVMVHASAGYIDPGYEGCITLELLNKGVRPIKLYCGQRVGQISFETMTSSAEYPYGDSERDSKYNTLDVPCISKLDKDYENRSNYYD